MKILLLFIVLISCATYFGQQKRNVLDENTFIQKISNKHWVCKTNDVQHSYTYEFLSTIILLRIFNFNL